MYSSSPIVIVTTRLALPSATPLTVATLPLAVTVKTASFQEANANVALPSNQLALVAVTSKSAPTSTENAEAAK